MGSRIEVYRNEELLFADGLLCSSGTAVQYVRQDCKSGVAYYLFDLNARCDCGKLLKDHDGVGVAVGVTT